MPLKSLELYNFKSYKGTQVIDFGDAPFVCIIGPNGSGKSNLMDAISFVLGVKSAQLRSTQLRDLVYRGRVRRGQEDETEGESLQASGDLARNAHVTAVYEDGRGKLWRFKRTITTSGHSSYSLNTRDVTYREYNTQLEKFNVLVKAKNFLVFQGDVEGVASQDSKALAALVDRISGSLDLAPAYEQAKAAQEKSAEATSSFMVKKRTMQSEVKHFEEQRKEVDRWQQAQVEKEAKVQQHLLWRLYHLTTEIEESTRKVRDANQTMADLRDEVEANDATYRDSRRDQAQSQLEIKRREGALKKNERTYEDHKPELVAAESRIGHIQKRLANAQTLSERVQRDRERQNETVEELQRGAEDVENQIQQATEEHRQLGRGQVLSAEAVGEYTQLRSEANALVIPERQQLEVLRREDKTRRDAFSRAQDKLRQAEQQRATLTDERVRLNERKASVTEQRSNILEEQDQVKAQLDQATAERQRASIKETELNEKLQDVLNKLLTAGADKSAGDREVKMREVINTLKRVFPGVHGRVVDLCRPTAAAYELAVQTVLGRNLDSIVVDHEQTAIDCIEYMRNQRAGQATFIPLDTIQIKPVQEKLRAYTSGARLAIACIDYDVSVERAFQYACDNTMICDSIDIAKTVCYERNQQVKAITLDGSVFHKSGLITGGQGGNASRRFNDADVQNLQKAKDSYLQQLQDLERVKSSRKDDDVLLDRLARLDANAKVTNDDLDSINRRLNDLNAELDHLGSSVQGYASDVDKQRRTLNASNDRIAGLTATVSEADDGVFEDFCEEHGFADIREYEDVQVKLAEAAAEAMASLTTQKARIKHQLDFEAAQLRSTEQRLLTLQSTIEKAEEGIAEQENQRTKFQRQSEKLEREVERARSKLEKARNDLSEINQKVDEARDQLRKAQRSLDKTSKETSTWNDEIARSASDRHAIFRRCRLEEIDLPLLSGDLDKVPLSDVDQTVNTESEENGSLRPPGVDDYGITPKFDDLTADDMEDGSPEYGQNLEDEVERLKLELERIVPNMKALDRLKDVRAENDEAQKEVDEARRDNRAAQDRFQELKKRRCTMFNAAYQHMTSCIDEIYKELTKSKAPTAQGGVAFLSLEDAEEPYLSGVKYNVMPPGKPFVEMEQLSGGEKTMAALALLFAIHSFHPAPFFVLDEVDAALDQNNVEKLARYVRNQAEKEVQFLIISLKPDLYQHADGLVGVYREQVENTSKSLTLDLRKYVE